MKTLKIKIKTRAAFEAEALDFADRFDNKRDYKTTKGTYFESLEAVRKILTDKRLEVWRTVRDEKPGSISGAAKLLDRSFRAVHRDMVLLKELGLIELEEAEGKRGRTQRPRALVDELVLSVA